MHLHSIQILSLLYIIIFIIFFTILSLFLEHNQKSMYLIENRFNFAALNVLFKSNSSRRTHIFFPKSTSHFQIKQSLIYYIYKIINTFNASNMKRWKRLFFTFIFLFFFFNTSIAIDTVWIIISNFIITFKSKIHSSVNGRNSLRYLIKSHRICIIHLSRTLKLLHIFALSSKNDHESSTPTPRNPIKPFPVTLHSR